MIPYDIGAGPVTSFPIVSCAGSSNIGFCILVHFVSKYVLVEFERINIDRALRNAESATNLTAPRNVLLLGLRKSENKITTSVSKDMPLR